MPIVLVNCVICPSPFLNKMTPMRPATRIVTHTLYNNNNSIDNNNCNKLKVGWIQARATIGVKNVYHNKLIHPVRGASLNDATE